LPVKEGGILPEVALGEVAAALAKAEEILHAERDELAAAYERVVREKQDAEKNVADLMNEMENRQRVTDAPAGSRDSV
jgi:hypothetical protein